MATETQSKTKTKNDNKGNKRTKTTKDPNSDNVDSFPVNNNKDDDPFSLLIGGSEGGFLSLEEFDESEYALLCGSSELKEEEKPLRKSESKKRKRLEEDEGSSDSIANDNKANKKKKKKKNKKKKKKKESEVNKEDGDSVKENGPEDGAADKKDGISTEEFVLDEEFYAWKDLRLHPLLMKSICRLGFKEPTPIQKACIPAAAHQGKDVVGAAETGSGKTLAFGLPILQRLLEEREKAARFQKTGQNVDADGEKESYLRALIIAPTRELALQVSDHLKEVAKLTGTYVVPIVGGMSTEKQERLLKKRPEIVVGTPGRLWELMLGGQQHLVELHSLSFFVLDEADRMIENGHFHELQSIIDMLPSSNSTLEGKKKIVQDSEKTSSLQIKKRQTLVFSATIALSAGFRRKLKRGSIKQKTSVNANMSSIESLSERAGMRADVAIVDLTNASIMADKLEESFIECSEEDKEAYLYYLLSVHGHGRTIVFCTSVAALRRIASLLRILGINVWTLHAQMQQRARLKAMDRFRGSEHGILVATDVAARGLDIPGVRTVIHFQLPHSAEVYVHRSGRTARASADGCCIALISPSDRSKFGSLCKSFPKDTLQRFPIDKSYMPEVAKRLSLARQIDNILRKCSQEKAKKSWFERNAESVELFVEESGSEEERVKSFKQKKTSDLQLKRIQQELNSRLERPLQPKTFSYRYFAGAGVSPLLQRQLEELGRQSHVETSSSEGKKRAKLVVIGQDCVEPLQALRSAGHDCFVNVKEEAEKQKKMDINKRKRREERKRFKEQRRKERKKKKENAEWL